MQPGEENLANKASKSASESAGNVGSTGEERVGPDQLVYLLPEEITVPEHLDVRPYTTRAGDGESEIEAISKLAETIAEEGQIQPVRVRYGEGGGYELVAGRRRVRAISLINAGLEEGKTAVRVMCVVRPEEGMNPKKAAGHAFRQAMIENVHRQQISPMDFAADIRTTMDKMKGMKGADAAKKVAEFFKVSPATITQHLKLFTLSEELQRKVHDGVLSRDAAFQVAAVPEVEQEKVVQKAEELQKEETVRARATGKRTAATRETGTVKGRHVRAAVREVAPDKPTPRTRKEIVDWFGEKESPVYGHPDGDVQTFVREFVEWCKGGSSDRKLTNKWDAMVEKARRGSGEGKGKGDGKVEGKGKGDGKASAGKGKK